MPTKKWLFVIGLAVLQTALPGLPAGAGPVDPYHLSATNRQIAYRSLSEMERKADRIIREAFEDILRREPDEDSLVYYRSRIVEYGWTEQDLREDLRRGRESRPERRMTRWEAEEVVRRAYLDVIGREPGPGSRKWVDKVLYDRWTEQDVARALRDSDEYRRRSSVSREDAERIVWRAYRDVLKRDPDSNSRVWVDKILYDRWTEQDVVRALRESDEYKRKSFMSRQEAEQIVRRAYLAVLEREPDPGSRFWVDKVMNEHWTVEQVARALRDSNEYRRKHR